MGWAAKWAEALGRWTARWVPSAFSIAVLLTAVAFALAMGWADQSFPQALAAWGGGFWELLTFSMQMALVMFTGTLLALCAPVRRGLEAVASLAKSPRTAVGLMAFASMAMAYVNWGLSIVGSAMLVRFIVRRQPRTDYRLLVASAYFGLGATWHAGLSASAPLLVATPGHFLEAQLGVLPLQETLFSAVNLGLVVFVTALLTLLAVAMHPREGQAVTIDPALLDALGSFTPPSPPAERSVAQRLDHGPLLSLAFGALGLLYVGSHLAKAGGLSALNINTVNFLFLSLAIVLHRTPSALLAAADEAASVLSGIVLQFPLYAGIYGLFRGTGLTEQLGDLFVRLASADTFPTLVYWYSGVVNYFVPSGGSKWAIEAPYLLEAAKTLGVAPAKVVLAYAWGDMATDLIQPFWALPLLAAARLEFKAILGFLFLAFLVYLPLVSLAFYLFV
jgi:short-chain fatty acids transporter